jgi:phospholipase/carboxylesterase
MLGGLRAHVVGEGDGPVVVLCHGFGAPGDDLVDLGHVLRVPSVRFVFPEAPLALDVLFGGIEPAEDPDRPGGARAWWMIDLERLAGRAAVDRAREVPPGLADARARLESLLDEVERRMRPSRLVLGGFSQGAMLACDVALRSRRPLAGLVLLSGTLLCEAEWTPLMPARRGLRALVSHGAADPLLPIASTERLRDLLTAAGLEVEWVRFSGGHEIPPPVMARLGALIADVAR